MIVRKGFSWIAQLKTRIWVIVVFSRQNWWFSFWLPSQSLPPPKKKKNNRPILQFYPLHTEIVQANIGGHPCLRVVPKLRRWMPGCFGGQEYSHSGKMLCGHPKTVCVFSFKKDEETKRGRKQQIKRRRTNDSLGAVFLVSFFFLFFVVALPV